MNNTSWTRNKLYLEKKKEKNYDKGKKTKNDVFMLSGHIDEFKTTATNS